MDSEEQIKEPVEAPVKRGRGRPPGTGATKTEMTKKRKHDEMQQQNLDFEKMMFAQKCEFEKMMLVQKCECETMIANQNQQIAIQNERILVLESENAKKKQKLESMSKMRDQIEKLEEVVAINVNNLLEMKQKVETSSDDTWTQFKQDTKTEIEKIYLIFGKYEKTLVEQFDSLKEMNIESRETMIKWAEDLTENTKKFTIDHGKVITNTLISRMKMVVERVTSERNENLKRVQNFSNAIKEIIDSKRVLEEKRLAEERLSKNTSTKIVPNASVNAVDSYTKKQIDDKLRFVTEQTKIIEHKIVTYTDKQDKILLDTMSKSRDDIVNMFGERMNENDKLLVHYFNGLILTCQQINLRVSLYKTEFENRLNGPINFQFQETDHQQAIFDQLPSIFSNQQ